jgi:hypothetical protein
MQSHALLKVEITLPINVSQSPLYNSKYAFHVQGITFRLNYSRRPLKREVRLNNIQDLGSYLTENILRQPRVKSGMEIDARPTYLQTLFNL